MMNDIAKFLKTKLGLVVICLVVVGGGLTGYLLNERSKTKELERIEAMENEYKNDLTKTIELIQLSQVKSSLMISIYSKTWRSSIKSNLSIEKIAKNYKVSVETVMAYAPKVEKRVYGDSIINKGDFDTALNLVHGLKSDDGTIGEIKGNRETVRRLVKLLKDPPVKYEEAYKEVLELYSIYEKYTELAIYPSGTLMSYTADTTAIEGDMENQIQKLAVIMP